MIGHQIVPSRRDLRGLYGSSNRIDFSVPALRDQDQDRIFLAMFFRVLNGFAEGSPAPDDSGLITRESQPTLWLRFSENSNSFFSAHHKSDREPKCKV